MIESKFIQRIAEEVAAGVDQVTKAVELFDGGATIAFVAHYRKDATGHLTEPQLEKIAERNTYFGGLANRRDSILQAIEKQGVMTDALRDRINACWDKLELEDYFLPFKKSRPTKATVARQKGLESLADILWAQDPDKTDIPGMAQPYVLAEKAVSSVEEALEGAQFILSERITQMPEIRAYIRTKMLQEGKIASRSTKNADAKAAKFEAYFDFTEPAAQIPSHRMLAILRGVRNGVLRMDLQIDDAAVMAGVLEQCLKTAESAYAPVIRAAVEEAYQRHLRPALEHEVVGLVRRRADQEAIRVFRENARNLMLASPAGQIWVLGVNPGLRTGCALAVVDPTGKCIEHHVIHPNAPLNEIEASETVVADLVQRHSIKAVAIGNGTAARETGRFFKQLIEKQAWKGTFCVFVNDSGATAYATSKLGHEEFPDLDDATRAAVSIARRLQDPLLELVKVEPRHVGVGQYQHDVNQRRLREGLNRTVEACVNQVGVDLNTASVDLLRYVSGIQMGTAQNIVAHRTQIGRFVSRHQLNEVPGIGPHVFEQCAAFLLIPGAENPLDATRIHPEYYAFVEKAAASIGVPAAKLFHNDEITKRIPWATLQSELPGPLALKDIQDELRSPGRDPRMRFRAPKFLEGVHSVDDLQENMEMEGVVTNVTDFGAFVDIGVHQDGLVHLSQLANRFVRDPRDVVKVGQIVKVKVIKVDKAAPRISLSMKAAAPPPPPRRPRRPMPPHAEGEAAPEGAPAGEGQEGQPREQRPPRPEGDRRPRRPMPPQAAQGGEEGAAAAPGRRPERSGPPRGPRPPQDGEGGRPAGPRRDDRRGRDRDRDRDRSHDGERHGGPRSGPGRRPSSGPQVQEFGRGGSGESLNTLLADQLAALRDRLKP